MKPTAVVLAAGRSTRFAGTKQLALLGGEALVSRVVAAIPKRGVLETIVVVGHDAEEVSRAIGPVKGVRVVINPDYASGMASSISAGVAAAPRETSGALILLADQPFVTRPLVARVLKAFETRGGIVAAGRGDLLSPPAVFARRYFGELLALRGDQGAKPVMMAHRAAVSVVRVRSRRALSDIDTRDDLQAAEQARGRRTLAGGAPPRARLARGAARPRGAGRRRSSRPGS